MDQQSQIILAVAATFGITIVLCTALVVFGLIVWAWLGYRRAKLNRPPARQDAPGSQRAYIAAMQANGLLKSLVKASYPLMHDPEWRQHAQQCLTREEIAIAEAGGQG